MMRLMQRRLDSGAPPNSLADEACVSRYHFQRVFRHVMGETPGDLQRRLRLERAAHDLRHTPSDVTAIAFDAGYESLEGFSRAFRRAYGKSPSRFRKENRDVVDLHGASLVHYDAQTRTLRTLPHKGEYLMDLVDRMLDNDYRSKRGLLESARALTDAQLDAPFLFRIKLEPWMEPDQSIREALDRLTDMVWVAELLTTIQWPYTGVGWSEKGQIVAAHSVQEMIDRLDGFYKEYSPFVQHVKENNLWETTWLDSACKPAETFTYASVIEVSLEYGIVRRLTTKSLLAQIGALNTGNRNVSE